MNPLWIDPARSRIVLVGVPSYADDALKNFEVIGRNVDDLLAAFTDPTIGGLDPSHCAVAPPGASMADIGTLLGRAAEEAEDLLLFYYCGHGLIGGMRDRQLYLSVHDTVKGREAYTALPFEGVRHDFLSSKAPKRIVILDCCFSGRSIGGTLSLEDQETAAQLQIDASYILASAPRDYPALVLDEEEHTAFTHRFLEVLHKGKPGTCEALTLADIYELLQSRLIAAGLPRLQALATGGAEGLPLVRNRAFAPETMAHASGDDQPDAGSSVHPAYGPWLATIYESETDGLHLGCGVAIDERRILTCARILTSLRGNGQAIWTDFPRAGRTASGGRVPVHHVSFPASGGNARDLAILHLSDPLPVGVSPAPLRSPKPADLVDRRWWAFGFPYRDPVVSSVVGQIGASPEQGLIRLDNDSGLPIGQGFIGGGLWSPDYNAVVAVIVGERGGGNAVQAITLHQAGSWFPGETIRRLAERWSPAEAGDVALAAWGWSLSDDLEGPRHWRPRARGVGIDSERGHRFCGRTAALREIVSWLDRKEPDRRVLVVTGAPGAGKSAVLGRIVTTADAEVASQLPASDTGVRATAGSVACAVHAKGKTALEVATEIARAASVGIPERTEDFGSGLREVLEGQGRRFNVIVDALDEAATPAEARTIVRQVILPIAETCADVGGQVVVGTRRADSDGDILDTLSGAERLIDLDDNKYFASEDLAAYAQATLQLAGSERHGNPYNDGEVAGPVAARITELSEGNFLVAGLIARSHGMHDEEPVDPAELWFSPTVGDALREYLSRIPLPAGVGAVAPGISVRILLTALAFAESPGFPPVLWRAALRALGDRDVPETALTEFARSAAASFLVESSSSDGEGTVFRLFHQALNDALLNAWTSTGSRAEAEAGLTRAFLAVGQDTGWEHAPAYLLRSLSGHADGAEMIDELLADDAFLLHSDLRRIIPLADDAESSEGRRRSRLLRFTPQALSASPEERAALFGVTEVLDNLGNLYHSNQWGAPYQALWANTRPRLAHTYLNGHVGHVNAVCEIYVDGMTLVATAGSDNTVRIWNPRTGEQLEILIGHKGHVNTLCMVTSTDDAQLASGSDDGTVRLWNIRTGQEVRRLGTPGHWLETSARFWVKAICEVGTGDQKLLADAGTGGIVRLSNANTGEVVREIRAAERVWSMCEVPVRNGFLLATGSGEEEVRLWNPHTGSLVHTMTINFGNSHPTVKRQVHALCVTSIGDRTILAIGGRDPELWDPESGNRINTLHSTANREIRTLFEIDIEGHRMLAGSDMNGGCAQIWDLAGRHRLSPLEVRPGIDLIGIIRAGRHAFLACKNFDTIALQDAQEVFQQAP